MRISDWSSDVCSSDLAAVEFWGLRPVPGIARWCGAQRLFWPDGTPMLHEQSPLAIALHERHSIRGAEAVDRKSVVMGKGVSGRVDLGGRPVIKKKTINRSTQLHKQSTQRHHTI